jgi:hypothetical protein
MDTIQERLKRLTNAKRGKGRLPPAPQRSSLPKDLAVAYPVGQQQGGTGGIASPLTEQGTAPTEYYHMTSSDGFVVFEYGRESYYTDANGDPVQVINLDRWG